MNSLIDFLKPAKERVALLRKEKRDAYYRRNREFIQESKRRSMRKARAKRSHP